jgi:peptidoglycan hydrolase-like protein with peptidoglycan-binding domain
MARRAKSLDKLLEQVNAAAPGRSKLSDGWIGDAAHAASKSDHNPNSAGVVQAIDITHDPRGGLDSYALAQALVNGRDARVKYIISNGRIVSGAGGPSPWVWRAYGGTNKHDHHVHVSVVDTAAQYDDVKPWAFGPLVANPAAPPLPQITVLRRGSMHADVKELKDRLIAAINAEAGFGPITEGAVKGLQTDKRLTIDGVVGRQTWHALGKG